MLFKFRQKNHNLSQILSAALISELTIKKYDLLGCRSMIHPKMFADSEILEISQSHFLNA